MQQMVLEAVYICRSGDRFAATTESVTLVLTNCVLKVAPELNWNPNNVHRTDCIENATDARSPSRGMDR
jgi:hypothetical protein